MARRGAYRISAYFALVACVLLALSLAPAQRAAHAADIGGPFELVDQTGRTVTDADYRGKYLLVYFGYTYCPDVCPTELLVISQALDQLGDEAKKIQPLFITVDPERDTVKTLAQYVKSFHPSLVGLTGTPEQIKAVAKAYRVYYRKAETDDEDDNSYLMDHTSYTYLMGPDGEFITVFPYGQSADKMAESLRDHIE